MLSRNVSLCLSDLRNPSGTLFRPHLSAAPNTAPPVQAEKVEAAEPFFQKTWKLVQDALDLLPKELHGIKLKPPPPVCCTGPVDAAG